jgi:hypothetical protein
MTALKLDIEVYLDDEARHVVATDQRDIARWERADEYEEDRRHTRIRFLAWSAMTRQGLTKASWADFNNVLCVQAFVAADEEDGEGEQGLDPGRRTASAS